MSFARRFSRRQVLPPRGDGIGRDGSREYTCARCGETFQKAPEAWSSDDAKAESLKLWGKAPSDPDMAIVCDPCFQFVMEQYRGLS